MTARAAALLGSLLLGSALGGCAEVIGYTDKLVDARTGRTPITRVPATVGGLVGFIGAVPLDIAALPVTWTVYATQDEITRDPLSIFLFPSILLWKLGTLIAAPIDLVEWGCWRVWQPDSALTPEERERLEAELDHAGSSDYPVEAIYPRRGAG